LQEHLNPAKRIIFDFVFVGGSEHMHLKNVPTMRSTFEPWLFILLSASLIVIMWETAKNLWLNWGTTNFWVSSLVAALVGMFVWWGIGAIAYLSAPRKTKARKGNFRDFIRPNFTCNRTIGGLKLTGDFNGDHLSDCRNSQLCLALGYRSQRTRS